MIVQDKLGEVSILDVQNQTDDRHIYINQVGISDLKIPLEIYGCESDPNSSQTVQATLSIGVDLAKNKKGIHMSRLVETILEHSDGIRFNNIPSILEDIMKRQESGYAHLDMQFNYFFTRVAPVSKKSFPQAYKCCFSGTLDREKIILEQGVEVPVQTLCPCSKEISDYGAHNQRSIIWVTLKHVFNKDDYSDIDINIEDIISVAEESASSPLYPILKREDERYITMSAYDKPCFVEDVVRNVSSKLEKDSRCDSYEIKTINYESIHNHNAFAFLKKA